MKYGKHKVDGTGKWEAGATLQELTCYDRDRYQKGSLELFLRQKELCSDDLNCVFHDLQAV